MKFGLFEHMDDAGIPLGQQFENRLQLPRPVIVMVFTRIILPNTTGTSGQKALNIIRSHATVVLNAVIIALQTRTLTARIITSAQEAIDDWLAGIDAA